jgi:DNA-binding GntR family transcriptional regulator
LEEDLTELHNVLLVDQIYQKIKEEVLSNTFVPGTKINPKTISDDYKISVTPVKQALNRLVSEGLVESIPRRGMIVKQLSTKNLKDSFEARRMIELYCVPSIIEYSKTNPSFIEQLKDNIEKNSVAINEAEIKGNYQKQNNLDYEFHSILISASCNEQISRLYDVVGSHTTMFYLYGNKNKQRFEECIIEHSAILNSIISGDPEALTKAINLHIDSVFRDYNQKLLNSIG